MTTQEAQKNTPTLEFHNVKTVGDSIKALVAEFTGDILGEFKLEKALTEVRENNAKMEEYKQKLLSGVSE